MRRIQRRHNYITTSLRHTHTHTHTQTHIDDDVTTLLLAITASIKVAPDSKGICTAMLISVSKVLSQQ